MARTQKVVLREKGESRLGKVQPPGRLSTRKGQGKVETSSATKGKHYEVTERAWRGSQGQILKKNSGNFFF